MEPTAPGSGPSPQRLAKQIDLLSVVRRGMKTKRGYPRYMVSILRALLFLSWILASASPMTASAEDCVLLGLLTHTDFENRIGTLYSSVMQSRTWIADDAFIADAGRYLETKFQFSDRPYSTVRRNYQVYTERLFERRAPLPEILRYPEFMALDEYKGSFYLRLNQELRSKRPATEFKTAALLIRSALNRMKGRTWSGPVYRVVRVTEPAEVAELMQKFRPGELVSDSAFTSTAVEPIRWPGRVFLEIESKSGIDIDLLPGGSEKEVLFPPGTTFRVLSVDESSPFRNDRQIQWTVRLVEEQGL